MTTATLDQYRLETKFHGEHVIHTAWEPDLTAEQPGMKVIAETRWSEEREILDGFSDVQRQKDERGQLRVVKRIKKAAVETEGLVRELSVLKGHPKSLAQFLGWYEEKYGYSISIIIENAPCGNLDQYLRYSGPAAKLKAKEITRQLLVGLDIMHKQNICHLDIKPHNIHIVATSPIWAKIGDSWLEKRLEEYCFLRTGEHYGTSAREYEAPELRGILPRSLRSRHIRRTEYNNAAYLWSLGALVHTILTLEAPFLEQDSDGEFSEPSDTPLYGGYLDMELLFNYCHGKAEFPTEGLERSKVSRTGIEFVMKLMAADPLSRMSAAEAICSPWLLKETHQERLLQAEPYKLQTAFDGEYSVIHTAYKLDPTGGNRKAEIKRKWTWERDIGKGTFGVVYLEKGESGKYRAVKKLARTETRVDYSRELSLLAKLADVSSSRIQIMAAGLTIGIKHHDLFVQFLGWYEDKRWIFIAMEYMEHGDLSKYLGNPSIRKDAKEITRQILGGLAVLHGHNICHRDLKPQNVLVACTEPIWVKITDFGISKDERGTLLHTACGTPMYLAPEVLLRGGNPYTNAVDIWALGCLLYQIFTSETPFLHTTSDSTMSERESGAVCPPSRELDMELLIDFFGGKKDLPIDVLRKCDVGDEAIAFLQRLLVANPNSRMSATDALKSSWLLGRSGSSLQKKDEQAGNCKTFSIVEELQGLYAKANRIKLNWVENPPKKESVRFPADENFWNSGLRHLIKYTSAQIHKVPDNNGRRFLIDSIPSNGRNSATKRILQDVWEFVWKLVQITQLADSITFGIPVCVGITNAKDSNGKPGGVDMVFQVPGNLVNPRSLRSILLSPDHMDNLKGARIRLAKYLTRSVLFLNSINFVHKEIRPENIIIFDSSQVERTASGSDQARYPFLTGFRSFNSYGGPIATPQAIDQENIYRHPDRQGRFTEGQYNMKHDIYSLGVCLLGIALWESFVCYDENESPRISVELLAKLEIEPQSESLNYSAAYQVKETLVKMAQEMIPETLGNQYAEVTISCLRVLGGESDNEPENDDDNGDIDHFFSEEEISISSSYINEVLRKMEEITA